jgi:tol-pal system protein YbgF
MRTRTAPPLPRRRDAASAAPWRAWLLALLVAPLGVGCVTVAEYRKLERDVRELQRRGSVSERSEVADVVARLDATEAELARLGGRLDVAEHRADEALAEARKAREQTHARPASPELAALEPGAPGAAPDPAQPAAGPGDPELPGASPDEVQAYRAAYGSWRTGDPVACIDQFRKFLQSFPASAYADDAAYWMADCYFKQSDFKTAILRFDDVVTRYPSGNKAADALYRQGEALLRLGPGYAKAAGKAFERVIKEYPDSERVPEARRQLELLRSG